MVVFGSLTVSLGIAYFLSTADFIEIKLKFGVRSDSAWGNILDIVLYRTSKNIICIKKQKRRELCSKTLEICKISHLESHANAAKNKVRHNWVKKDL